MIEHRYINRYIERFINLHLCTLIGGSENVLLLRHRRSFCSILRPMKFTGGNFWLKMAADQIVKSFLILVSVGCIVKYGSCAPIKGENLTYSVSVLGYC